MRSMWANWERTKHENLNADCKHAPDEGTIGKKD